MKKHFINKNLAGFVTFYMKKYKNMKKHFIKKNLAGFVTFHFA